MNGRVDFYVWTGEGPQSGEAAMTIYGLQAEDGSIEWYPSREQAIDDWQRHPDYALVSLTGEVTTEGQ